MGGRDVRNEHLSRRIRTIRSRVPTNSNYPQPCPNEFEIFVAVLVLDLFLVCEPACDAQDCRAVRLSAFQDSGLESSCQGPPGSNDCAAFAGLFKSCTRVPFRQDNKECAVSASRPKSRSLLSDVSHAMQHTIVSLFA